MSALGFYISTKKHFISAQETFLSRVIISSDKIFRIYTCIYTYICVYIYFIYISSELMMSRDKTKIWFDIYIYTFIKVYSSELCITRRSSSLIFNAFIIYIYIRFSIYDIYIEIILNETKVCI